MKCKCGKETINGRCKSCSNRDRTGKYKWNNLSKEKRKNEGNPFWKGNKAKVFSIHRWVESRKYKPNLCENFNCINKPYELANISGKYHRNTNDFRWLCRSCHSKLHRGKEWSKFILNKRMEKKCEMFIV